MQPSPTKDSFGTCASELSNYNEDRVAILLNVRKPKSRSNETWPQCSYFAVYDGHGGSFASEFLRDHLHKFIMQEPSFPSNPPKALTQGFARAEGAILELQGRSGDKSGSCAVVLLVVGDTCYVANVGDSRAVLGVYFRCQASAEQMKVFVLTKDHKPSDPHEQQRILEAGGRIYQ